MKTLLKMSVGQGGYAVLGWLQWNTNRKVWELFMGPDEPVALQPGDRVATRVVVPEEAGKPAEVEWVRE